MNVISGSSALKIKSFKDKKALPKIVQLRQRSLGAAFGYKPSLNNQSGAIDEPSISNV